jgi:hypothetical protein
MAAAGERRVEDAREAGGHASQEGLTEVKPWIYTGLRNVCGRGMGQKV